MNDASWDNSSSPEPREGMPTWAKVLLGCLGGCALLVVILVASCVGLGHYVSKDPKGFENRVKGWVQDWAKEDWARLQAVERQLRTEEGTRALYRAQPDLKDAFETEDAFAKAVAGWRPNLKPIPDTIPDLDGRGLEYNRMGSRTTIGFRDPAGATLRCTFQKERLLSVELVVRASEKPADGKEE